jgi:hypothetical protein
MTRSEFCFSDYEPLDSVIARANEWMLSIGSRVVNVETVHLPNRSEEGQSVLSGLRKSGETSSHRFQIVRVCYEREDLPAENPLPLPPAE